MGEIDIKEKFKADVKDACAELPTYKQISKVVIRQTEFDKTTTKKIKRQNIAKSN